MIDRSERHRPGRARRDALLASGRRADTEVAVGEEAIRTLTALAWFVDDHSEAFSTSSAWLVAAARNLPGEPVTVTVRTGGAPVALAALAVSRRRGARRIELLGAELNDYARFYYDDEPAARALATALVAWIREERRWTVTLSQLPPDDPVLVQLVGQLPGATVEPGPPIPQIIGIGDGYAVSRNRRRAVVAGINRLETDGRRWETIVVTDPVALGRWLPAVVDVRRQRDHACGRRSHLDDPAARAFYETVLRDAVAGGRASIDLLVVDEELAGYCAVMIDDGTHRYFDGRVAERWHRYRGGHVTALAAVKRAAETPGVTTFDWLRGSTDAKFGNHEIRRTQLRAASHSLLTAVDDWEVAARQRVKAMLPASAVRRIVGR